MKKLIAVFMVAGLATFTACKGPQEQGQEGTEAPAEEPTATEATATMPADTAAMATEPAADEATEQK
jgi:hypothetical protein